MMCGRWEDVCQVCRDLADTTPSTTMSLDTLGTVALLHVAGDLDIATVEALLDELTVAVHTSRSLLVVDLEACTYVGIQPFEAIERAASVLSDRGAQLVVRMPPPSFELIRAHVRSQALVIARPPQR